MTERVVVLLVLFTLSIVFALSWVLLCHHHETATDDKRYVYYALGLYDLGIVQFVSTNLNKEFFWRILRRNSMT